MKKILLTVVFGSLGITLLAQGKLLKRVAQQTDKVSVAYAETWNTFYGNGYYKKLMKASLDTRPDGTPNIVLDEATGAMAITIRLSVNVPNYEAWKKAAHARFAAANLSYSFSDFEDVEGRMIGGKNYKFGENEELSIRRWEEKGGHKSDLTIRVRLVSNNGNAIRETFVPLSEFKRLGFVTYPIPLHNLNRLMDLPKSRFHWFDTTKEPKADLNIEDGYAKISYKDISKSEQNELDDVVCEILDEVDMKPIYDERARKAQEIAKEKEQKDAERLKKAQERIITEMNLRQPNLAGDIEKAKERVAQLKERTKAGNNNPNYLKRKQELLDRAKTDAEIRANFSQIMRKLQAEFGIATLVEVNNAEKELKQLQGQWRGLKQEVEEEMNK